MTVSLLFLILAAISFGCAAFGVRAPRVHLGWLGALLLTLSFIF